MIITSLLSVFLMKKRNFFKQVLCNFVVISQYILTKLKFEIMCINLDDQVCNMPRSGGSSKWLKNIQKFKGKQVPVQDKCTVSKGLCRGSWVLSGVLLYMSSNLGMLAEWEGRVGKYHRKPKLTLRTAHKLDCFFHAKHNNDIGTLCIIMASATFKSLYGNATKRLKLPQIRKKSK